MASQNKDGQTVHLTLEIKSSSLQYAQSSQTAIRTNKSKSSTSLSDLSQNAQRYLPLTYSL